MNPTIDDMAEVLADIMTYASLGEPRAIVFLYGKYGKTLCHAIDMPYKEMWEIIYNGDIEDEDYGDSPYGRITWN